MTEKEGWAMPLNAKKYHYFMEGMSLCARFMFIGTLEPDDGKESPDDCKACRRKLEKKKDNDKKKG